MLPVLVSPFHDTDGLMFEHLASITPQLKKIFARAFISVSPLTQQIQPEHIEQLQNDEFFMLKFNGPDTLIGDHFMAGYQHAVDYCQQDRILHLCTLDRVVFALQTQYKEPFAADLEAANQTQSPILFQRSERAWQTHPQNYREIEVLATKTGEIIFGKSLDFIWCHMVIRAGQLQAILPHLKSHDLSVVAEMVILLQDKLQTIDVDWLAWEDPFIFGRDPVKMKKEFENDPQQHRKCLAYVIPILQRLLETIED
jgi:hypothetical protein